jgi:hypothetical protein
MTHRLITVHSPEGNLLASRVVKVEADAEVLSQRTLEDAQRYFNIPLAHMILNVLDDWDAFSLVSTEPLLIQRVA